MPKPPNWTLKYDVVSEWNEGISSTYNTKKIYARWLGHFCRFFDITPDDLIKNTPEKNEELLNKMLEYLENDKDKKKYYNPAKSGINSFLRYHNKKLETPQGERKDQYGRWINGTKKYEWLLDYECIIDWIEGYDSERTQQNHLYVMDRFLKEIEMNPDEFLELGKNDYIESRKNPEREWDVKRLIRRVRRRYKKEGKLASGKRLNITMKSFFEEHRILLKFTRKERIKIKRKRVKFEYIPSKAEIYAMADSTRCLRDRAIILLAFHSGIRRNAIVKLTYGMIKDYIEQEEIKVPVYLRITSDIDTKISSSDLGYYYTFLQHEAIEAIKLYVEQRKEERGWKPKDDDLLFVSERIINGERKQFLAEIAINRFLKKCAKRVGIDPKGIWIHCIRKAFRKILYQTEPMDNDMAEALMGHIIEGSKENYFDRHDLKWIASVYMEAPFGREATGKIRKLDESLREKDERIKNLEKIIEEKAKREQKVNGEIAQLKRQLTELTQLITEKTELEETRKEVEKNSK
jgi:integrase